MNTALYFGSFNPIHFGHLSIAQYMVEQELCNNLWLVVSPHNPLKEVGILSQEHHRFNMCQLAIEQSGMNSKVELCDVEFGMPKPSWTIDTLKKLIELYPNRHFSIVMGADNLLDFHRWKDWETILKLVTIYVYPRSGYDISESLFLKSVFYMKDAPIFDIDSTTIRERVSEQDFLKKSTYQSVIEYINNNNIYG